MTASVRDWRQDRPDAALADLAGTLPAVLMLGVMLYRFGRTPVAALLRPLRAIRRRPGVPDAAQSRPASSERLSGQGV